MFLLFAITGITLNYISQARAVRNANHQSLVYIDKLIQIANIVENQTGKGLTADDIFELRPYFQYPAFYETDFPFILSANGEYLLHAIKNGQRVPSEIISKMKEFPDKTGSLNYEEFENNKKQHQTICFKYYKPYNAFIGISYNKSEVLKQLGNSEFIIIIFIIIASIIAAFAVNKFIKPIVSGVNQVNGKLKALANGEIPTTLQSSRKDEIGLMTKNLNQLITGLKGTSAFARQIGNNQLNTEYSLLSNNDEIGNALLEMQENLKKAKEEEAKRKEEDDIRKWFNEGLAQFGEILRQNNNDLSLLADNIIQSLVNYLNANQGGIFVYNENDEGKYLELLSSFAYNRKKFVEKVIQLGEGLVGTCAQEKQTIYLKEIPANYISITSGLGEATPTSLLIAPLKLEEDIFGVLEIASFQEFKQHEIEFVEKIGESIASTLHSVKNNIRTRMLLEQSQQQREEMAAQEEEMRQNMEEMQATQEEMERKNNELEIITNTINQSLLSITFNQEGYIVNANSNFQELTGYSKTELEDKKLYDLVAEEQQEHFNSVWKSVLGNQSFTETFRLKGKNDLDIYIMATISPGLDAMGYVEKVLLIGQDITEEKKLEIMTQQQAKEIEKNLKKLRIEQEISATKQKEIQTLLSALDQNCLVSIIEPNGMISYINNMNVNTLGDKKEDIEGKYLHEIDYTAKHRPEEFKRLWNNIQQGNIQHREFSLKVNGKTVWILENFTPVMDEDGNLYKIINIGYDITANKVREQELNEEIELLKKKLK